MITWLDVAVKDICKGGINHTPAAPEMVGPVLRLYLQLLFLESPFDSHYMSYFDIC